MFCALHQWNGHIVETIFVEVQGQILDLRLARGNVSQEFLLRVVGLQAGTHFQHRLGVELSSDRLYLWSDVELEIRIFVEFQGHCGAHRSTRGAS